MQENSNQEKAARRRLSQRILVGLLAGAEKVSLNENLERLE